MLSRRATANFRRLDLNLLRVFDTVMAEGSLTRAAEVLAITQPAASHALKRLHQAVGETLFVRSAFGMKPTDRAEGRCGRKFAPRSRACGRGAGARGQFDPLTQGCGELSHRDGRRHRGAADPTHGARHRIRACAGRRCGCCRCPRAIRGA